MIMQTMSEDRLTPRQQRFVNAYAANGMNGTAAAREAGYSGDENALAAAASRMLRLPKIKAALRDLVGKATEKATRGTVGDLAETLGHLFTVRRARLGDYLNEAGTDLDPAKVKTAPEGLFRMTPKGIEQVSPLDASKALLRHYDGLDKPKDPPPTINIGAILVQLSSDTLRELKATVAKALPEKTA